MKLSNTLLSIVAIVITATAVSVGSYAATGKPSTVIYVKNTGAEGSKTFVMPENMTHKQAQILDMAYNIAKKDGHTQPQLLQGIIIQESQVGAHKSYKVAGQEFGLKPNERYYGLAQIKLAAAKDVNAAYPNLNKEFNLQSGADEEIIANLMLNDKYNLSVASKYLLILQKRYKVSVDNLAAAYNQGPGGQFNENAVRYASHVTRHTSNLKRTY